MKCLSLWQPWGTLVVIGAKRYETRHWQTDYVGWVAIHAAKYWTVELRDLCTEEPFRSVLFPKQMTKGDMLVRPDLWPPRGFILGLAYLEACVKTSDPMLQTFLALNPMEEAFGDYTPGRYAWRFSEARAFVEPFAFSARQGLFNLAGDLSFSLLERPVSKSLVLS